MPLTKKNYITSILEQSGNPTHINSKLCCECGGRCCDTSGCGLMPCDVPDMSINGIRKMLDTGKYSIAFFYMEDEFGISLLPVLASREVGAGKVNHSLIRRKCALKTKNGCPMSDSERPSQALLYVPCSNGECRSLLSPNEILEAWYPYNDILEYIVRVETGKSSEELFDQACREATDQIKRKIEAANGYIIRAKLNESELKALYILTNTIYIFELSQYK